MKKGTHPKTSWWAAWIGFGLAASIIILIPRVARTSPAPGLQPGSVINGYFGMTVTNGVPNEYYEIYSTPTLGIGSVWTLSARGDMNQTNFALPIATAPERFFRAVAGTDTDGDGVLNWRDADPFNAGVGALTITIETPANGSTID